MYDSQLIFTDKLSLRVRKEEKGFIRLPVSTPKIKLKQWNKPEFPNIHLYQVIKSNPKFYLIVCFDDCLPAIQFTAANQASKYCRQLWSLNIYLHNFSLSFEFCQHCGKLFVILIFSLYIFTCKYFRRNRTVILERALLGWTST